MKLWSLSFNSPTHREDDRFIGIFSSEKLAIEHRDYLMAKDKVRSPNHPSRYQQRNFYYDINEIIIDEPDDPWW